MLYPCGVEENSMKELAEHRADLEIEFANEDFTDGANWKPRVLTPEQKAEKLDEMAMERYLHEREAADAVEKQAVIDELQQMWNWLDAGNDLNNEQMRKLLKRLIKALILIEGE